MNKKMAAIIKMLSSAHDGEVVNAARALGAELARNGKDWNDLGSYLSRWDGIAEAPAPPPKAPERPKAQTYSAGNGPSWHRRSRDPDPVDRDDVAVKLSELDGYTRTMGTADRNFIEGMLERFETYGDRAFCTPAQRDLIDRIHEKIITNKRRR